MKTRQSKQLTISSAELAYRKFLPITCKPQTCGLTRGQPIIVSCIIAVGYHIVAQFAAHATLGCYSPKHDGATLIGAQRVSQNLESLGARDVMRRQ